MTDSMTFEERLRYARQNRDKTPVQGRKTWTFKRVIPQADCPGTCCKKQGIFPLVDSTQCRYWSSDVAGRPFGGCTIWEPADRERAFNRDMPDEESRQAAEDHFQDTCQQWPANRATEGQKYYHIKVEFADPPAEKNADYQEPGRKWCECFEYDIKMERIP